MKVRRFHSLEIRSSGSEEMVGRYQENEKDEIIAAPIHIDRDELPPMDKIREEVKLLVAVSWQSLTQEQQ